MSRDWTPKEHLAAEQFLIEKTGCSYHDLQASLTITTDGKTRPFYSEEELSHRAQYPLLGKLLNNFEILYERFSSIPSALDILSEQEQILELYISSGVVPDAPVIRWFEGKMAQSFHSSEQNDQLFAAHLLQQMNASESGRHASKFSLQSQIQSAETERQRTNTAPDSSQSDHHR